MKKLITLIIVASLALTIQAQTGDITNTLGATDGDFIIESTTGGILIPKMTMTQRDAITGHVSGLTIYQTDNTPGFYYYDGSSWVTIGTPTGINDLTDASTANFNVFLGENTGANSTGESAYNVATGLNAMVENTTGVNNTASGYYALYNNVDGHDNVAIGYSALSTANATNNTAVGERALFHVTTGSNNTAIGGYTGLGITTGSGNVIIGTNMIGLPSDLENTVIIGSHSAERIRINGSGYLGINETNPTSTLDVNGSMSLPITTKSANYTATASDYTIVFTTAATLTLPSAVNIEGRIYIIKNLDSSTTLVTPDGTETIDGSTGNYDIFSGGATTFQSDGSNWIAIAEL